MPSLRAWLFDVLQLIFFQHSQSLNCIDPNLHPPKRPAESQMRVASGCGFPFAFGTLQRFPFEAGDLSKLLPCVTPRDQFRSSMCDRRCDGPIRLHHIFAGPYLYPFLRYVCCICFFIRSNINKVVHDPCSSSFRQ